MESTADEIVTAAHTHEQQVDRARLWCLDNNWRDLRRKLTTGLVSAAGADRDAAQAAARTISEHVRKAEESLLIAAQELEALQIDMQKLYIEPIEEWKSRRHEAAGGLKVN